MPKYDEVYRMRLTSSDKELLFAVVPDREAGASLFWRRFCVSVAHRLQDIKRGDMEPDEFGRWMAQFAKQYKKIVSGEVKTDASTLDTYMAIASAFDEDTL